MANKTVETHIGISGVGEKKVTNSSIIAIIINDANWDVDGEYTGSIAGLIDGSVHYDDNFNLRYHFDGTTLRRSNYNQIG